MSNRIYANYCKILWLEDDGTPRGDMGSPESYGYRVCDDYENHDDSRYDTFEELQNDSFRPETIVSFLINNTDLADEALERGIYFNGNWISGEELKAMQIPEDDDDG